MSEQLSTRRQRSGGRKHKGPRHPSTVRFPVKLYDELTEEFRKKGYESLNDYVIDLCRSRPRDEDKEQST